MIGDVIAEALPELRAQAESLMAATAVVTRDEEPHWDEATEAMVGGTVTVYDGPARLIRAAAGKAVDAAGEDFGFSEPDGARGGTSRTTTRREEKCSVSYAIARTSAYRLGK